LRRLLDTGADAMELLEAIEARASTIPASILSIHHTCCQPGRFNWLEAYLLEQGSEHGPALEVGQALWRDRLQSATCDAPLELLEFACGSANDYRAWAACGLDRFVCYHGGDISGKNVANCRRRFPEIDFNYCDVLDSGWATASVDVVMANDLVEHLPPDAMEHAVREMVRIARSEVWIGCFHLVPGDGITVQASGDYHINGIGERWFDRICGGHDVQVVNISRLVAKTLPGIRYHNDQAGVVIIDKSG
jgi:hypothetical protein